ncbi:hypothetical protein BDV95DRAFT_587989 [Massariosphaeria phaeospora]|uniref:Pentacotripeptide-repeat region of PRORP domain-containing protein n=1 Tax=Massariosphaeria phaeospora TaxID=100035 RepID=A0A7C8M1S6_9PLEO|nr:hypothetical protein BDV95DRAFT_587989 [Massariosphaeria phaeospora]
MPLLDGGKVFTQLSNAMVAAFCDGAAVPVTPTSLLLRFEQLGLGSQLIWTNTLAYMTNRLLKAIANVAQEKQSAELVLFELLSVWRLLFQCKGTIDMPPESASADWHSMPDASELGQLRLGFTGRDFGRRLMPYHPNYTANPVAAFSAITIFVLWDKVNQKTFEIPESLREQSKSFLQLITHLLAGARIDPALKHTEVSSDFRALPEEFQQAIIEQIQSAPEQAMLLLGSEGVSGPDNIPLQPSGADQAANLEQLFLARIARAVKSQSEVLTLEHRWNDAIRAYTAPGQKTTIPTSIYNAFLSGFMTLNQSQRSVRTWNHMIAHGLTPDVLTWSAMMDGCVKSRDRDGLDAMWKRMLAAGVEPDNHAWTTRIHGLFTLKPVNVGFAALDELGNRWLAGEIAIKNSQTKGKGKGKKTLPSTAKIVNNSLKPTIEIINAAIDGIASSRQKFAGQQKILNVQRVLQWAGNFEVKSDARTYNTVIKLYLEKGDYKTVFALLRQMEKDGVEADIATHTMLINASFQTESFSRLSATEQADHLLKLFGQIESGGLRLGAYVYSSTIDRLLKQYNNFSAVRKLIDHMMARKLIPSPHIYTSLITYYLQQNPPNIPAVDSLWMQILATPGASTDKFFFDRLIEGYAANGETGKMMTVLTRMSKHGKMPGFQALTAVLRALVEAGDWERARLVVRDVQRGEGVARSGITSGNAGQRAFFDVVRASGLAWGDDFGGQHVPEYELEQEQEQDWIQDQGVVAEESAFERGAAPGFAEQPAGRQQEFGDWVRRDGRESGVTGDADADVEYNGTIGGVPL